jgi:hypothetical protein
MGMLAVLLAGTIATGAFHRDWAAPRAPHGRDLLLLYVGADDCVPCRTWQGGAGEAFRTSPEFARVSYREVKSPTLFDVLGDEHWPEDLRGYRDQLGPAAGVPLWLVIADREIVERGFGASQWHGAVLPKLKSLLR